MMKPDLAWQGSTGYRVLDEDRRLKVDLTTNPRDGYGTSGTYIGLTLTVVSKTHGKIDSTTIYFNEVGMVRADARPDYNDGFKVISHCGWSWYIAQPKTVAPLVKAVEAYAKTFA